MGDVFIADTGNHEVEKVTADGVLSIVAGTGQRGSPVAGRPATSTYFDEPRELAVDAAGNLYIVDSSNDMVDKVTPGDAFSIIAGVAGTADSEEGDPVPGPATASYLLEPRSITITSSGVLFVADTGHQAIEKLAPPTSVH